MPVSSNASEAKLKRELFVVVIGIQNVYRKDCGIF